MKILVCSIIVLFSCVDSDRLNRVCAHSCYTGYPKTENVGQCKPGMTICDADGSELRDELGFIICDGQVLPTYETCDNIDNDCDGVFDEVRMYPSSENFPCMVLGECSNSHAICVDGSWQCEYRDTVQFPEETRCDNKDNDCDGRIDEDIFANVSLGDRVCYSGNPIETLSTPPCRAGLQHCIHGEVICLNEIIPGIELCDGIDNNCDGVVDNTGEVMLSLYDIVFIVDTSGSMCDEISAVAGALNAYAQQFDGNPNFRFALVIMSKSVLPYVQVDTDFSDFASIRNRLLSLGCNGGGYEASMDSMLNVCDQVTNSLNLSWREEANSLFFMFTDENQQSYTTPRTTGQDVIDACVLSGTLPFIWSRYPLDFEYVAQGANGIHFNLIDDWQTIFNDMNSIIVTLCGNGG